MIYFNIWAADFKQDHDKYGPHLVFYTSSGDVLIKSENFYYNWCDLNIGGLENDIIRNFDLFISM